MTIRQRLVLAFATMACVPLLIIAAWTITQERNLARENFRQSNTQLIGQIENAMTLFFDSVSANVDYLAGLESVKLSNGNLKKWLGETPSVVPETAVGLQVGKTFQAFAEAHRTYGFITLGTADGGATGWPTADLKNYDPRVRPWYQAAVAAPGQTLRTAAYEWAQGNTSLISTVKSVTGPGGEVVGVVDIDVSLQDLTNLIKQARFGETGFVMLLQSDGIILADGNDPSHAFRSMSALGDDYGRLASAADGMAEVLIDELPFVVNVVSSKKLGWKFISLIQRDEVMSASWRLSWQIMIMGLVLAVVFGIIGALLASRIVQPIKVISKGLENIVGGEGDLTCSLDLRGRDETAQLAGWFNRFLDTFREFVSLTTGTSAQLAASTDTVLSIAGNMRGAAERQHESIEMVSTAINEMVATAAEVAQSCGGVRRFGNAPGGHR